MQQFDALVVFHQAGMNVRSTMEDVRTYVLHIRRYLGGLDRTTVSAQVVATSKAPTSPASAPCTAPARHIMPFRQTASPAKVGVICHVYLPVDCTCRVWFGPLWYILSCSVFLRNSTMHVCISCGLSTIDCLISGCRVWYSEFHSDLVRLWVIRCAISWCLYTLWSGAIEILDLST